MNPFFLKAKTIPDAWFQLIWNLIREDVPKSTYTIDAGSYAGQKRLEFDFVTVEIEFPGSRPLIPEIPVGLSIPPPVDNEYVSSYFSDYLMDPFLKSNEEYKYASWLYPGVVTRVINDLKKGPGNNQATISLGGIANVIGKRRDGDIHDFYDFVYTDGERSTKKEKDPACLRVIDFRLDQENRLHMFVYFRSWCLWAGFPANLAGLQLFKEYIGQEIEASDGKIIACSKGLHLYDHEFDVAAMRVGK